MARQAGIKHVLNILMEHHLKIAAMDVGRSAQRKLKGQVLKKQFTKMTLKGIVF